MDSCLKCKSYEKCLSAALADKSIRCANYCNFDTCREKVRHSKSFIQLNYISKLTKNWNENNADPFSLDLINKCKMILHELSKEPEIFPTACNSIQFEYEKESGEYLEFEIYDKSIKFFKIDSNGKEEMGLLRSNDQIQIMKKLIDDFYTNK